ncbi:DNA-binding protein [Gimibacter soli]|uniref:DNA-binding protein n=1 Tax=Gimibacter soli TaxID=3024400 RepID=A0AAF0BL07_9PROT|nr:DNA-binding protein [Gimibacter soli]WCL52890.1 DNA-binding protein [Gimibacter soli]
MARTGIDKQKVKQARQALLARGENPSIDAVRAELGNTGSKTTIHRYLRELEAEAGTKIDADAFLSDTLRTMVANLADQLQKEAQAVVDKARTDHGEQVAALFREIAERETQLAERNREISGLSNHLQEEQERHAGSKRALDEAAQDKRKLELSNKDLDARLSEKASQIASLEEKHQHARDSLEHYRQSVKEQRDAENRRFEHQMQQLLVEKRDLSQKLAGKQEELSIMVKENSALATRLADAHAAVEQFKVENQTQTATLASQADELQKLTDTEKKYDSLKRRYDQLENKYEAVQAHTRSQEVELASLKAEVATTAKILAVFEKAGTHHGTTAKTQGEKQVK